MQNGTRMIRETSKSRELYNSFQKKVDLYNNLWHNESDPYKGYNNLSENKLKANYYASLRDRCAGLILTDKTYFHQTISSK